MSANSNIPGRRASEYDRDAAAIGLMGYVEGILEFFPEGLTDGMRADLRERIEKVRATQGFSAPYSANRILKVVR